MSYDFKCLVIECDDESQWLQERTKGIGASETASIFGVGFKGASALTVWCGKTGGPVFEVDAATQKLFDRGHMMEPVVAQMFATEMELPVIDPGNYTIYRSESESFLFATLDRLTIHAVHGLIPVELKTVHGRFWFEWEDGDTPLKYQIQCQHQMAVTGATHCYLAALIGGDDLQIRLLKRDDAFISIMLEKLDKFWQLCLTHTMPDVDNSDATARMIGVMYPQSNGSQVSLPADFSDLDIDYLEAKEAFKKAKDVVQGIENRIKAAIGESSEGVTPGGTVFTYREQTMKAHMRKESTFRVLRRKSRK
jgi:putative phage-type endonuclease